MELYEVSSNAEKMLQIRADHAKIPLGGSFELLPLCNMDCKMCYVRKSKAEMNAEGRMLSCDEWLDIGRQAVEAGTLFVLLTGGEPLLYPEFARLYEGLQNMGLILTVNTNGTLINEKWAVFFAEHQCRRLNITIYGKDDETYGKLCNNPKGFTQLMNACGLLKERNVPFRLNCSVTPGNVDQMADLYRIAESFEVPLFTATYMYAGARRGISSCDQYRLTPAQTAAATIQKFRLEHPNLPLQEAARQKLSSLDYPSQHYQGEGFSCHAGHSGFWMNWKGEMTPCGMCNEPVMSAVENSFDAAWKYIVEQTRKITFCEDCKTCDMRNMCHVCPAHSYTETGCYAGKPEYLCAVVKENICQMRSLLNQE